MVFEDEMSAILSISDYVTEAANGLFVATKYVYSFSAKDFYSCDIKDVFRIILNNPTRPEKLEFLGISISGGDCAAVNSREYAVLREMILYSFAVRLPIFQTYGGREGLTDAQAVSVYETVLLNAEQNARAYIRESFEDTRRQMKKQSQPVPYRADWYRAYIYDHCDELAEITNRNFFFLGAIQPLFSMFSLRFEKELSRQIKELAAALGA